MTQKELRKLKKDIEWDILSAGANVHYINIHTDMDMNNKDIQYVLEFKINVNLEDDELLKYISEKHRLEKRKVKLIIR